MLAWRNFSVYTSGVNNNRNLAGNLFFILLKCGCNCSISAILEVNPTILGSLEWECEERGNLSVDITDTATNVTILCNIVEANNALYNYLLPLVSFSVV